MRKVLYCINFTEDVIFHDGTWILWENSKLELLQIDDTDGGATSLLSALPGDDALALSGGLVDGARTTLYAVHPKAGRLFLMPNACPHEASGVVRAPKVLIRGELRLADSC